MKLIITRPQHDVTTRYLSVWAGEIINFAANKGIAVLDLAKEKADKKEFEGRINKLNPEIVFLNGHGDDGRVTGHDNKDLVNANENSHILAGKITYALSCNSGKVLGHKVAKNKNTAYVGYLDEFIFVCDGRYLAKPLDNLRAKPFMESSNQIMVSLLKGNGAKEASERSKNRFRDNYTRLLSSSADPDSLQAAQCLWWDMKNQVCLGEMDATL